MPRVVMLGVAVFWRCAWDVPVGFGVHLRRGLGLLVFLLYLGGARGVRAGLIMEDVILPASGSSAWALASVGDARYAGGWLPLDGPLSQRAEGYRGFAPVPLRLGSVAMGALLRQPFLWGSAAPGSLSAVEQLLLGWALQVPVYPRGPVPLPLTERMLLVPRQLRITLPSGVGGAE